MLGRHGELFLQDRVDLGFGEASLLLVQPPQRRHELLRVCQLVLELRILSPKRRADLVDQDNRVWHREAPLPAEEQKRARGSHEAVGDRCHRHAPILDVVHGRQPGVRVAAFAVDEEEHMRVPRRKGGVLCLVEVLDKQRDALACDGRVEVHSMARSVYRLLEGVGCVAVRGVCLGAVGRVWVEAVAALLTDVTNRRHARYATLRQQV